MDDIFPYTELKLPLQKDFLPLAMAYIEKSAEAFNFGKAEVEAVRLAGEEIFSFLVFNAESADDLTLILRNKASELELSFKFAAQTLPVKALNVTSRVVGKDKISLEAMGLLIAARSVDKLRLEVNSDGKMLMSMMKKKSYAHTLAAKISPVSYGNFFQAVDIDEERLEEFCSLVLAKYAGDEVPAFISQPDKLADMLTQGEFDGCFAEDENHNLAGALLWYPSGKMLYGYGFYTFSKPLAVAKVLWEGCMARTAMIDTYCMFIRNATKDTPDEYFQRVYNSAYAFMANGESDIPVYIYPPLVPFAENFYRDLSLSRQIYEELLNEQERSALGEFSAFAADMDKENKEAVLSVLWVGKDAAENLKNQSETLIREGFKKVRFELAIENSPHAIMGEFLLKAGFKPELIIPWTDEGDILSFVYVPEN